MKIKLILSLILYVCALNCVAQTIVPHIPGDPRIKRLDNETFSKYADAIEAWRENPADLLAAIGEDLDWAEDVNKAKSSGGYVVEAEIKYGEPIELCMTPADAYKVTHLKLTGRAFKWGEYDQDDLNLDVFLRKLKNLKVLNLRDLDCELINLDRFSNVEKIVLPANCTGARITGNNKLKNLVFGPRFEGFGYVVYGGNTKYYETDMTTSFLDLGAMKTFKFPEGVLFIGGFTFGTATQSVTFPSTLKIIEYFGEAFTMSPFAHQQIPSLKEIHVNATIPPKIRNFPFEYEHLKNVTLYVPRGSKAAYMKDLKWRNFGNIVEEDVIIETKTIPNLQKPIEESVDVQKSLDEPIDEPFEGKWKFIKHEVHGPNGKMKNPAEVKMEWVNLKDGIWEESGNNGNITRENYTYENGKITLGQNVFDIDKADEKELILTHRRIIQSLEFRMVFMFSKME